MTAAQTKQFRKGLILVHRLRVWPISHGGQECETASHIASTGRMQPGTLAHGMTSIRLSGNTFSTPRGMFSWSLGLVKLTRFINHHSKLNCPHRMPAAQPALAPRCQLLCAKAGCLALPPTARCSLRVPWERSRVEDKWPRPVMLTSRPPTSLIYT